MSEENRPPVPNQVPPLAPQQVPQQAPQQVPQQAPQQVPQIQLPEIIHNILFNHSYIYFILVKI
jgi:hypothetical protein